MQHACLWRPARLARGAISGGQLLGVRTIDINAVDVCESAILGFVHDAYSVENVLPIGRKLRVADAFLVDQVVHRKLRVSGSRCDEKEG